MKPRVGRFGERWARRIIGFGCAVSIFVVLTEDANALAARPNARGSQSEYAVAYQLNPAHSGSIAFSGGFPPNLGQIWTVTLDSKLSYPLIVEGLVISASENGTFSALDLSTGSVVWQTPLAGGSVGLAYDNGQVFTLNYDGVLSAYNAQTGVLSWAVNLAVNGGFNGPPMAVNGMIYVSDPEGEVQAVDETTGVQQWAEVVYDGELVSPAFGDGGIYFTFPGQYYDFAPADGRLIWCTCTGEFAGGGNTPAYFEKRLYVQDWTQGNSIRDAATGKYLGTFDADITSSLAFFHKANKTFGVSLYQGILRGWNTDTQKTIWRFTGDRLFSTSPIVVNEHVLEGSGSGMVFMVDSTSGKQVWSAQTSAPVTSLAAGQGTLIVVSGKIITAYVPQ
jgi:outer membrane protein assembly factor BamB